MADATAVGPALGYQKDNGSQQLWDHEGIFMERAAGHNAFSILFIAAFFASVVVVMLRFA